MPDRASGLSASRGCAHRTPARITATSSPGTAALAVVASDAILNTPLPARVADVAPHRRGKLCCAIRCSAAFAVGTEPELDRRRAPPCTAIVAAEQQRTATRAATRTETGEHGLRQPLTDGHDGPCRRRASTTPRCAKRISRRQRASSGYHSMLWSVPGRLKNKTNRLETRPRVRFQAPDRLSTGCGTMPGDGLKITAMAEDRSVGGGAGSTTRR